MTADGQSDGRGSVPGTSGVTVRADGPAGVGYGVLLGLVLLAVLIPLVAPVEVVGLLASILVQGLTVVVAVRVAAIPPRLQRTILMLVGGAFVLTLVAVTLLAAVGAAVGPLLAIARGLGLVLALVVPVLIVRDVVARPTITMQTVAAVLCVYLLLGLAFAFLHRITDGVAPGSYSMRLEAADAVYLSYVTLTTVGFGDVTPVGGFARAITVFEAILGQLYLVSVVALIVGNVGRTRPAVQQDQRSEDV